MDLTHTHKVKRKNYLKAVRYYKNNKITIKDCALKFKISRHNLSKWIIKSGGTTNKHNKQSINSNVFKEIDSEEKAYWLGFMFADGYLSSNKHKPSISLELALKDREHLDKFRLFLQKEIPNKLDHFRARCIFQDKQIYKDLLSLGCTPRKSNTLKFPDLKKVPKRFLKHFIRGYIDGDGSIYITKVKNKKYKCNIKLSVLGTKEFLNDIIKTVNLPERQLYIKHKESKANCYFFEYSGKNCLEFLNFIYKDANIFLKRKYNKYLEYCRLREEIPQIITAELSKEGENPNLN